MLLHSDTMSTQEATGVKNQGQISDFLTPVNITGGMGEMSTSHHSISDYWLARPAYLVDVHSVQPARINWTYCLFDCKLYSTLLAHEFGTVCQLTWSQQRLLPRSDRDSKHFCLENHLAYSGPISRLCYLGHLKHLLLIDVRVCFQVQPTTFNSGILLMWGCSALWKI